MRNREGKVLCRVELTTYIPSKYLILDTETGDIWRPSDETLRPFTRASRTDVAEFLYKFKGE